MRLRTDRLPNLLPSPTEEERESLKNSIKEHGFWDTQPIVIDEEGNVLDGHTRLAIAKELRVTPPTQTITGLSDWEKVQYAVTSNTSRRHLTTPARRTLLKKLMNVHEDVLKQEAKEAQKAGGKKGAAKSKASLNETKARAAAADATASRFDEPVVAQPKKKAPTKDTLATYGKMLGASRATIARDRKYIQRVEKIEAEAEEQGNTEVLQALNNKNPDLTSLEEQVGLREKPEPEPDLTDDERLQWVDTLAKALDKLAPRLGHTEAKKLVQSSNRETNFIFLQIRQIEKVLAEVAKEERG